MDHGPELTLRAVRLAQENEQLQRTAVHWHFFPGACHATWGEARELLAATAKPVIVAALVEPGAIALWHVDDVEAAERAGVEHELLNQQRYFDEKLEALGLDDGGSVVLETPAGVLRLTVAEFRRWAREYALSIGLSLGRSTEPGTARLLIRPPGGGRPPLGLEAGDPRIAPSVTR